jgi:signal peptidase I
MVDFEDLSSCLQFDDWGDIILWRSSTLSKDNRYIIYEYLKNKNKIIINIGQIEGNISSKYYQSYKIFNYIKKHKYTSLRHIPTYRFNSLDQLRACNSLSLPIIEKPDE